VATLTHPFGDLLSRIAMQNQLGGALSNRRDDFPLVFQHDAVLKPQDCGGCVVNLDGKAVGLNIARAGRTETYAIPTESVLEILNKLRGGVLETSTAVE
jgi:serine protease Do